MENRNKVLVVSFFAMAIIAMIVFAFVGFEKSKKGFWGNQGKIDDAAGKPGGSQNLTGDIYLSLVPKEDKDMLNGIYGYDVKSGQMKPLVAANHQNGEEFFTSKVSLDGKKMVYSGSINQGKETQLFISDASGKNPKQLTTSQTLRKRTPDWSPSGELVVFQAIKEPSGDFYDLANWNIFTVDMSGKEQLISSGAYPHFLDEERVLILKKEGLFVQNIKTGRAEEFWAPTKQHGDFSMKVAVSRDKKHIAWSVPAAGIAYVLKVESLDPIKVEVRHVIEQRAYWPVFSPDGKFMALQTVDANDQNPKLVFYDTKNFKVAKTINLDSYVQEGMFVTDWR